MTNEQLTQEIMVLKEHQAKAEAEHDKFDILFKELQEDVKSTKTLAEDVHIMAINMERMQNTLDETSRTVFELASKDAKEYNENKKLIKQKIISAFAGAIGTGLVGLVIWVIKTFS